MIDSPNIIKVLVVEDDLLIAENIKDVLQDFGYEVDEPCNSLSAAQQRLGVTSFDIAILDINLNGKDDGILLGRQLSTKYQIPFIFLTSFSDKTTIASAATSGPSAYLVKPVSPPNLFAAIQTALHNYANKKIGTEAKASSGERSFFVKIRNTMHRIYWEEVVCVKTGKNYVTILTNKESSPAYPIRSTLQQILNYFIHPDLRDNFIQVNRSQCINKSFVNQIQQNQIITPFGNFEIGEKYKKSLLQSLETNKMIK